jgi:2',3'-cyclic-nucleotide 2'-phosphodiesterase (5'-nucleotidase family)
MICLGNHDFDFGMDILSERVKALSRFTCLNSNVYDRRTSQLMGSTEYCKIVKLDGITFGFFGLCTEETPTISYPGENAEFQNYLDAAHKAVEYLKGNNVDVIIALTHLSLRQDMELTKHIPDIKLIIGGHDHNCVAKVQGETLILKSGHDATYLGAVRLQVKRIRNKFDREYIEIIPSWEMILNQNQTPNSSVSEVIQKYLKELPSDLEEELACCEAIIDSRFEKVRSQETVFGNLVADAIQENYGCEIAVINGGGIRGDRLYPPGHIITKGDLLTEMPFTNPCYEIALEGQDLLMYFEQSLTKADMRHGSFPNFSNGIEIVYDIRKSPGERVQSAKFQGETIDPLRMYRVVTTKYNLGGGDGMKSLLNGKPVENPKNGTVVRESMLNYLLKHQIVHPIIENRLVCLKTK